MYVNMYTFVCLHVCMHMHTWGAHAQQLAWLVSSLIHRHQWYPAQHPAHPQAEASMWALQAAVLQGSAAHLHG